MAVQFRRLRPPSTLQAQTVREWVAAAGAHAEAVHHAEVVQPRDLVQVQADEIHVKTQAGVLWMAMAMMVSTRLWLGGDGQCPSGS